VNFDGTNDYATRGADWTGNSDTQQITISCWVRFNGGDGNEQVIYITDTDGTFLERTPGNKLRFVVRDSGGGNLVNHTGSANVVASSTWRHVLTSANLATGQAWLYLDGVADGTVSATTGTADFTKSNHIIGAYFDGSLKLNADLADLYINRAASFDPSNAANLAKFISGGLPVNLGADGSLPSGTAPIGFFRLVPGDAASTFATNKGTGGGMTVTGTLTTSSNSPSG
jgi:hypothetical protein